VDATFSLFTIHYPLLTAHCSLQKEPAEKQAQRIPGSLEDISFYNALFRNQGDAPKFPLLVV
jgi:hypothetical protein